MPTDPLERLIYKKAKTRELAEPRFHWFGHAQDILAEMAEWKSAKYQRRLENIYWNLRWKWQSGEWV